MKGRVWGTPASTRWKSNSRKSDISFSEWRGTCPGRVEAGDYVKRKPPEGDAKSHINLKGGGNICKRLGVGVNKVGGWGHGGGDRYRGFL